MTVTEAGQYEFTNPEGVSVLIGKGTDVRVNSVTGLLDWPDKVGGTEIYGDRHGGYYNGQGWLGVRRCIFSIAVHKEKESEETHALLESLAGILAQGRADGHLTVQRPGKEPRRLICHAIRTSFDAMWSIHQGLAPGAFEVEAADPMWYSEVETALATGMEEASVGRTYPRAYPLIYGAIGDGGFFIATNEGNMETLPVLRIHGPVDTPLVYNRTVEKYIKFDIVIPAGSYLEVDAGSHTALLDGTGNRRNTLNSLSEWWGLVPGDNEIRFQANVYHADAFLEMEMRSAYATA